jgi:predicted nucleic acid-binding protein
VVVDANVLVALAIPTDYSTAATQKVRQWMSEEAELFAPALWSYEAVSAIRKYVAAQQLSHEAALGAVSRIVELGIREARPTLQLLHRALDWADRLQALVAYDAAYVALAEQLAAEFWTADRRLVNRAKAVGVAWIHSIVEPP